MFTLPLLLSACAFIRFPDPVDRRDDTATSAGDSDADRGSAMAWVVTGNDHSCGIEEDTNLLSSMGWESHGVGDQERRVAGLLGRRLPQAEQPAALISTDQLPRWNRASTWS